MSDGEGVKDVMARVKWVRVLRWTLKVEEKEVFEDVMRERKRGVEESKVLMIAEGWGVDSEENLGDGKTEYIRIEGLVHIDDVATVSEASKENEGLDINNEAQIGVYADMEG